ncbi:MAG: capsule assembly Wzi family protein [Kiloniellaceae bacterium]
MAEETAIRRIKGSVISRVTTEPALVRDFAATGREEIDARARLEYMGSWAAARLSIGYQGEPGGDDRKIALDDSYLVLEAANFLLYAGYIDHWWGPGWISSLILSNNARPFPRVGFMRNNPKAFETPWLSWIGPWQIHGFVGVLEEDGREVSNPIVLGLRLAVNPLRGLELGASRAIMLCGNAPVGVEERPCGPETFINAFLGRDNAGTFSDPGNQLAGFDARFSSSLGGQHFTLYGQYIGEDEASGLPSKEAGLFGLSLWGGVGDDGALWRLTTEYSDSTAGFFKHDPDFNVFYDHFIYKTGYRYRGRSIGHSLDNDSRLFSVVGTLTDLHDWTYRLAYHRAEVNRDGDGAQPVSTSAENINLIEAGLSVPWGSGTFEAGLRFQDDQPNTPGAKDLQAAVEVGVTFRF